MNSSTLLLASTAACSGVLLYLAMTERPATESALRLKVVKALKAYNDFPKPGVSVCVEDV